MSRKAVLRRRRLVPICDGGGGLLGMVVTSAGGAIAVAMDELGDSWSLTLRGVPAHRLMRWICGLSC